MKLIFLVHRRNFKVTDQSKTNILKLVLNPLKDNQETLFK